MLLTQHIEVAGHRVRLADIGQGPVLVLLHGYPDTLQIFSPLAERLVDRFRILAFDWPGMGGSEAWSGGASPFHMAERLGVILDALDVDRPLICGHDMGGQPALVFAARNPQRVRGVVVMNSLVVSDEATSWEIALLRRFRLNRLMLRHVPRAVFSRAIRTSLDQPGDLSPDLRADFSTHFREPTVREFIVRMCAGYQGTLPRLPEDYRQITVPVTALWGESDHHFPPSQGQRLVEIVPGASLQLIRGGDHWMVLSRAEQVAEAIAACML